MISGEGFAWVARAHGHLALLSVVLLAHPVVTMRGPNVRRWTQITAELAAALTVTVWSLGAWLYPTWRREVKPPWVLADHGVVPAFEVKEHLAAVAAALAVSGVAALRAGGPEARATSRTLLALALLSSAITAGLGIAAAGVLHPAY